MSGKGVVGLSVSADAGSAQDLVLTDRALGFLEGLERRLRPQRLEVLAARQARQLDFDRGLLPDFPADSEALRQDDGWRVVPAPADLMDRRVEITGPVERKMVINALNSGAQTFMADFEDANSPTWSNCVEGQRNLMDAVRRTITLSRSGKQYRLGKHPATLLVRPRGWHLEEKHVLVDGRPMSASLFDFGLFVFHNAAALLRRGSGPYLYLPKLEGHLEARLWELACQLAEEELGLPAGCIRTTVLIENILAAFEMDEILFELRSRCVGLNAGRWDYLFSVIRKFRSRPDFVLPDRAAVTMTVPFMRAYTDLLVRTCHRRGAHAIGGMAAFVPNRSDPEGTRLALQRVAEDKVREAGQGFDGTWVAHPDLVATARSVFEEVLRGEPNQLGVLRADVQVDGRALLNVAATPGRVTRRGIETNVSVGVRYLASWLGGQGAVAIDNLMEDAATAEISRSQIWQWRKHGRLDARVTKLALDRLGENPARRPALELFTEVALGPDYIDFLTVPGYSRLP